MAVSSFCELCAICTKKEHDDRAALKKVDMMASDAWERYASASDKMQEFADAGYPAKMRRYVCQRVGRETKHTIWFTVAKDQMY